MSLSMLGALASALEELSVVPESSCLIFSLVNFLNTS